jgi:outer membrane protein assembly factor BamB
MSVAPINPGPLRKPLCWWPAILLLLLIIGAVLWVHTRADWPFQKRNLTTYEIVVIGVMLLLVWWTFFSRAPKRMRLSITFGCVGLALLGAGLFRISGMSGDLLPIVEFRWAKRATPKLAITNASVVPAATLHQLNVPTNDFPQFYGPNRDGVLPGLALETNWMTNPPQENWRRFVGAGWSGFAIVGEICVTQEQDGSDECVVAYHLATGAERWRHRDTVRYTTTVAGEGPRATPTIVSNRVYTFGATGLLNCLDLANGQCLWSRDVVQESGGQIPQWGATSSPLMVGDLVIVHGGEAGSHSLFAYHAADGKPVWQGGTSPSYSTPILATLAGAPQVLAFNDGSISGLDPTTGATLWQRLWGNGNVVCATPLVVSSNRVLFSSGYGVGAELLAFSSKAEGKLSAARIWKSIRMKSKFAHMFVRDGCVFGLDDGIFACIDLADGSQKWKEGRYGHGQGLLVGELYLLVAESGELVLLRPTPEAPNEITRLKIFNSKTWNPPALSGDLLLLRNDREAVCLRLPVVN